MKSIINLSVLLFSGVSLGATLTCGQLAKAYQADLMNEAKYECNGSKACEARQLGQLRQTVKFFTDEDVAEVESLREEYQTIFDTKIVGNRRFEVVDIDLGDNAFKLFFDAYTAIPSGIASSDGTLTVDGKYCDEVIEFEPVINSSHRHALCRKIVPMIREKAAKTTLNHLMCTNDAPVDKKTGNTTSFDVEKFTAEHVWVRVSRNLHDVKGDYFICKARVSRKTNKVIHGTLACGVH